MIIKTAIQLSIVCITLLLSGCEYFKSDNLNSICEKFPELCDDLHQIGDCRFKRTTLIRARYYDKIEPTELHKRELLTELDEYHNCLEMTLFLQFTRNKHRKEQRLENYLRAKELIKHELTGIKGTQDPMLAYYLWTHYQDKRAGRVFLSAANKSDVSDPSLLFKLAAFRAKNNPQQAINLFYRALRMTNSLEQIPPTGFVSAMNIFYQHKQFEHAYTWALMAQKIDTKNEYPINLDLILQKGNRIGAKLINDERTFKNQANSYYQQLKDGNFVAEAPQLVNAEIDSAEK